jgi:hypothetical protein
MILAHRITELDDEVLVLAVELFTYPFATTKTANIHLAVCPVAIDETVGQSTNSTAISIWGAIPRPPCHKNPTGQANTTHPKPTYHTVSNTAVNTKSSTMSFIIFFNYRSSLTNLLHKGNRHQEYDTTLMKYTN